jgi:hypothetical protein
MALKNRSENIGPSDEVELKVIFLNNGIPTDTDAIPTITINQSSGNILLGPTQLGVYKISTGKYAYVYKVPYHVNLGIYNDFWESTINGIPVNAALQFAVQLDQLPAINSDGYVHLGDTYAYNYSQTEIKNINKLLTLLKRRLNSSGRAKSKDAYGNVIYIDCDIFDLSELIAFLIYSLELFNSTPHFTNFNFSSTEIIDQFGSLIVQGAVFQALAAKALIEKGTEFTIQDNGISHNPASVADLLNSQYGTEIANHTEMVKLVKANMKPFPLGLGTLTSMTLGRNTYIHRVRRARAFY